MGPWMWFLLVVAIGVALLAAALLADRRARRQLTGAGEPAPLRHNDDVDRHVPAYITQDEIDELPDPHRGAQGSVPHRGEGFSFGHAHRDFATLSDGASRDNASLLVVNGRVDSMRELFSPLARASEDEPLIVVADSFEPVVVTTLAANRRALGTPVVAAQAGAKDRLRLAELTGAVELDPSDLQAGYVPVEALGRARHWASTASRTWVTPFESGETTPRA